MATESDATPGTERQRAPRPPPHVQRMRVRVGIFVASGLALTTLPSVLVALLERRWAVVVLGIATTAMALGVALAIRRTRAVKKPGLVLVTWMFSIMFLVACSPQGLSLGVSAWPAVMALFALYLLGPRYGVIFVGVALAQMGVALALHRAGVGLHMSLAPWDSNLRVVLAAVALGLVGLIGYLYESAQQRTQDELEDALAASEGNERQLDAVIASAAAAICSIDRDLRLLVHNRAFAAMARRAPRSGDELSEILDPAQGARWQGHIERVLAGAGPVGFDEPPPAGKDGPYRETTLQPLTTRGAVTGVTVFCRDISARKRADAELTRLNQELVRISRRAGMAAVAGEVLHNTGNVLNSAGVSVSMLKRHIEHLGTVHLSRLATLVEERADDLEGFVRDDPRGRRMPEIVRGLADHFEQQQAVMRAEVSALQRSVEHLTRIIHAQQSHARAFGLVETVSVTELVDEVLDLQGASWSQLGITVERDIADLPSLHIDKHKVIEILVNLVGNARHSLRDSGRADKRLRIRAEPVAPAATTAAGTAEHPAATATTGAAEHTTGSEGVQRVRIHVEDNGTGIAPEHRERLFRLGFTTKHDGNGIGLHASAIAAQQLGGALSCHSDGPDQGATFTLELPLERAAAAPVADEPGAARLRPDRGGRRG